MKKCRRVLVLALLAAGLVAAGWAVRQVFIPPQHRINADSFEQIQEGMTLAEVEAILGVPPGDYCSDLASAFGRPFTLGQSFETWIGDQGGGRVGFDQAGAVCGKDFLFVDVWKPTLLECLRSWLPL